MATESIAAAYAGARVTRLVNRDDILERIADAVRDQSGRTYVFYIEAPGGTGKTFLAREVLRRCREGEWAAPDLLAAMDEVDLYHHQTHSREGFMAAMVAALQAGPDYFVAYGEQRQHLQEVKYDLRGAVSELRQQHDLLVERFLGECEELGRQRRVVVALDTVEKLVYETDRVQQALGLSEETFSVRPWLLKEWLPRMRNAVILICGRPSERFAADLRAALEEYPDIQLEEPKLGNFAEKDTLDYFSALRERAAEDGNVRALKRIDAISSETRRVTHHLTEGHPITLALMIDYYLVTGRLLPEVKASLAEVRGKAPQELKRIRDQVRAEVVRQFQEIGRPADEAIRALAWAPRGMDAELLARVAGMSQEEASEILEVLADPTKGLSFVKIRPADRRAFLQDEMYALMKEHVLSKLPEARAEEVYREILAYYAERIDVQRERVSQLGRLKRSEVTPDGRVVTVVALGGPKDPQALAAAQARLHDLLVEELYYHLRHDPLAGFETYSEQAEEAVQANDVSLDMQLHDELLTFMREAFGEERTEVGGLRRGYVERDVAIRWIRRNVYTGRLKEVARIIPHLRTEQADFLAEGGPLSWAELLVWESWAAAFLGSGLEEAETRLRNAVQTLLRFRPESEFERRQRDTLLARAYNSLGYLLRVRGRFQAACEAYRHSLPLWRDLKLEAAHADTLNNLAWANAEGGNFERAQRYCQKALEWREELGSRYLIALSFNTLGLIEIRADQPHRGRVHCERALTIFRELDMSRGIGLACTALAEAHRRSAETPGVYFPGEQVERLRLAKGFASQAVQIFREEVPERLRLVEALIELGCTYRNWAHLWPEYHDEQDPGLDELVEQGITALQEAARLAAGRFPYRQVDALVNLAWLHYYVEDFEQARRVAREARGFVPPEYYITKEKGLPRVQDPTSFLWVQMGKAHLLEGQMALRRYQAAPLARGGIRDAALLQEVGEHFTLGLAYDELFADDFRDMRRAKDVIYNTLERVNREELGALYRAVDTVAQEYHLERRPRAEGRPARPRMRNFLEEYFGTLEAYEEVAA
jgi:tetratricopeptide (TPR) repeat protein